MIIKNINALGVYGGASLNSVELALINTDGVDLHHVIKTAVVPYTEALAQDIRSVINKRLLDYKELETSIEVQRLKDKVSTFYAEIIPPFVAENAVDVVGVDSLTIGCDAQNHCSYQIENGRQICDLLGYKTITHFHKADLLSGGQASPLSAAFFNAIGQKIEKPMLFIDVGTISSLMYLGTTGELIAFDCAPGVAMLEDWTFKHANMQTDYNGKLAATGQVNKQVLEALLKHKFLRQMPPKSLDIMSFSEKKEHLEGLSLEDGAATVTAFIAEAVFQAALDFLPKIPGEIYLTGAGVKNPTLRRFLKQNFAPRDIKTLANLLTVGAASTAFNAVRRLYSLPITFPTTTGVCEPITGGEIYEKN